MISNTGDSVNYIPALGERLKSCRRLTGLSQAEVAQRLGIGRQAYSHYETGRVTPPAKMLIKLADILNVPAEELLSSITPIDTAFSSPPPISQREVELLELYSKLDERDRRDLIAFLKLRVGS